MDPTTSDRTLIILNPASAGGRTGERARKLVCRIHRQVGERASVAVTQRPGDATTLAYEAVDDGMDRLIVVGGDGTIQEVANGILRASAEGDCPCAAGIVSSGTGCGFAQSIGLPSDVRSQVSVLSDGIIGKFDVGEVECASREGGPVRRWFVNECQIGIGGSVCDRVQKNHKILGGRLAFGAGTFEAVFTHPNDPMIIGCDQSGSFVGRFTGIVVANGAYTGGGMLLAPGALPDDGVLTVVRMGDLSVAERLRSFPKIYSGRHLGCPKFESCTAREVRIESDVPAIVEADGEVLGCTPCRITITPGVLPVIIPHERTNP